MRALTLAFALVLERGVKVHIIWGAITLAVAVLVAVVFNARHSEALRIDRAVAEEAERQCMFKALRSGHALAADKPVSTVSADKQLANIVFYRNCMHEKGFRDRWERD